MNLTIPKLEGAKIISWINNWPNSLEYCNWNESSHTRITKFIERVVQGNYKLLYREGSIFSYSRLLKWCKVNNPQIWTPYGSITCEYYADPKVEFTEGYNKIIKLDEYVYYIQYTEKPVFSERSETYFGLVFSEEKRKWTTQDSIDWIIKFSKDLKLCSDKFIEKKENAFDSIFLNDNILSEIKEDVELFLQSKDIYENDLKLSWKRGMMFIGDPGNGKTSIIRVISKYWDLNVTDVHKVVQSDGTIDISYATSSFCIDCIICPVTQNPALVVLEDIDKFVVFQGGDGKHRDSGTVSLHNLLKALDGVEQAKNYILIATSNFAGEITESLVNRPGRFDKIWKIDKPNNENIKKLLNYHKLEIVSPNSRENNLDFIVNSLSGYSMAFVEEFVKSVKMRCRSNIVDLDTAKLVLNNINQHNAMYKSHFEEERSFGFNKK